MSEYHDEIKSLGLPLSVDSALDIMLADGMDVDDAARMDVASWRLGRDPEEFALHLVKLRRVARGE